MDTSRTKKPARLSKHASAMIAIVLAVVLTLSGTFAWYTNQDVINIFKAEGSDRSVVLHDEFDGGPVKRIYVENTGDAADVFVRIKLQEYLDLTSWNDRVVPDNEWQTHIPGETPATGSLVSSELEAYHEHFTWSMGGGTYYLPSKTWETGVKKENLDVVESTEGAIPTPDAEVILMADYKELLTLDKIAFIGWIYDSDGWAYWSRPLPVGETTGLLLNSVTPNPALEKTDYFYAINVILEAVDKSDLAMWTTPSGNNDGLGKASVKQDTNALAELATNDAIELLNRISNKDLGIEHLEIVTAPNEIYYLPNDIFNPSGLSIKAVFTNGEEDIIEVGYAYPTGELPNGTTHATVSYGGATVGVPITVHPVTGLKNKAPNTKTTIDGISWQVVGHRTVNGNNYVLLVTSNTLSAITHPNLTNSMTNYYNNTIKKSTTLMEALVVPSFQSTNYYVGPTLVYSRMSSPTAVLAKDKPSQSVDIAFALDHQEVRESYAKDFLRGNGAAWWVYAYWTVNAGSFSSTGVQTDLANNTAGVGYRPAIWVMVP